MTRFSLFRLVLTLSAMMFLVSCAGTNVVHQWQTNAAPTAPAMKLAIVAMAPEEGMRLATIVDDGNPETVKIGDKVAFDKFEEKTGPIFKVA